MTKDNQETETTADAKALPSSSGSRFVTWKWCVVVFLILPPLILLILPTGILRVIVVPLAELVEWIDDKLHAAFLVPFGKAQSWSKKPTTENSREDS